MRCLVFVASHGIPLGDHTDSASPDEMKLFDNVLGAL